MSSRAGHSRAPPPRRFTCALCSFAVPEAEHGRRPSFNPSVAFLEETFYMRDPLAEDSTRPVVIGGTCAACGCDVCAAPRCSLFYAKRLCSACVQRPEIREQLPAELLPREPP